ncbi:MAG: VTT domain-containing protein [Planctomycetota bacterium]
MPTSTQDWIDTLLAGIERGPLWLPAALFFATFVTEDLTCVVAGLLVAKGTLAFPAAMLGCALGIFAGDLALYCAGRGAAAGLLRWRWVRSRLPQGPTPRLRSLLDRRGAAFLFATRFMPGTRLVAYLGAGALRWPFPRFAQVLGLAVLIWTPLLVGLSTASGRVVQSWLAAYADAAWLAIPLALLCAWLGVRTLPLWCTWRGRRLLLAKFRRLTRWEYWPVWAVYPPVVIVLAFEALRHRRIAVFTACNPGIPHGGLALESKGDILDRMRMGASEAVMVAPYARLRRGDGLEERLDVVRSFMRAGRAVLKPDSGERGSGVAVIRSEAEARAWLCACPFDAIVQEWIGGAEFGVVWRRRPDGRGEIRSIARKVPPQVVGDGVRSLEDLILADDREVAMARFHLRKHAARLDEVPPAQSVVSLGELGTHCRGATFLDARGLLTPRLKETLDDFMARAEGLDFGRFDLRVPDDAHLQDGRGIRILEFNGVAGEPAHVYQPGYPLLRGLADLCSHWRAACATGDANVVRGHRPSTLRELLRLGVGVRRRTVFEADAVVESAAENAAGGAQKLGTGTSTAP